MESEADSNDLRVASFSVYLNSTQEIFVHKHGVSLQNLSPTSIVFPLSAKAPAPVNSRKITASGEIGVFGTEKYHNVSIDDNMDGTTTRHDYKKENHTVSCRDVSKSGLGTPSVSSKANMNSKTVLLKKTKGRKQNDVNGKSFLSGFSCMNFCANWKSICVSKSTKGRGKNREDITKENTEMEDSVMMDRKEENKAKIQVKNEFSDEDFRKVGVAGNRFGGHFAAPVHNNGLQNVSVGVKQDGFPSNEGLDSARISLEVFGSQVNENADAVAMNLGRKLSMLTWDAIPKSKSHPTSSKSTFMNDDLGSDASSDLFEIENLSVAGNASPSLVRQASDGGFPQHAASEKSIEWSVIKASAGDFPAFSDCDEKDVSENVKITLEPPDDTSRRKQGGTGLLGRKNQKAADVVDTAHRINTNPKIPGPH